MTVISIPFYIGARIEKLDTPDPEIVVDPMLPDVSPMQRMAVLYNELARVVAITPDPVVYAGDCLAIMGVIGGLQRRSIEPTLLFFDAHGDFHTWETTQSEFLGGMPLAMATGRGEQTIIDGVGMQVLSDERAWLVDGRDLDPGEDDAVAAAGIHHVTVADVAADPPPGDIYLHVDVDVVDPSDIPAVNYPAPGGPSLGQVTEAVVALHATGRVVAFSYSCWNPALPGAAASAQSCHRMAAPFLQGNL